MNLWSKINQISVHWIHNHPVHLLVMTIIITLFFSWAALHPPSSEIASTTPNTEIFKAHKQLQTRLAGPVHVMSFIVKDPKGDLWTPSSIKSLDHMVNALRNSSLSDKLWQYRSQTYHQEIQGLLSPTDLIRSVLHSQGEDFHHVSDTRLMHVAQKVVQQISDSSSQLTILSGQSIYHEGHWQSPAIIINVLADLVQIGGESSAIALNRSNPPQEVFARQVLQVLRDSSTDLEVYGVALDVNLSTAEQGARSGPYIGATLFLTLTLLGVVFRSYWVLTILSLGLATLMIWLKGASYLLGFKADPILSLIVPIAMISFGVDAAVHALARLKEEYKNTGLRSQALYRSLLGIIGALSLASLTDITAFLVNLLSELESVRQFGLASAIAMLCSFILLGLLCLIAVAYIDRSAQWIELNALEKSKRTALLLLSATVGTATVMTLVLSRMSRANSRLSPLGAASKSTKKAPSGAIRGRRS